MASLKRTGAAFVFAVVMAGGVLISSPAEAAPTLPGVICARLALAVETLTRLVEQFPDNPAFPILLEMATEAYQNHCQ